MNTAAKLGSYALGLVVIFGAALGVGNTVGSGPAPAASDPAPRTSASQAAASVPGGLQTSQDGYTLTPETKSITPGEAADFRFRITGPDGTPVTAYETRHDKKLHLILVNRTLGDFQHLHPELSGDGVWSTRLTVPDAGDYRAFADFAPAGGDDLTLGVDLHAPGDYAPRPLPATGRTATVDGYTVELDGELTAGTASRLALKVAKDGRPVTDLEPYLGAYGHLVALRAGDLAYLHVHPDGEPGDGKTPAGPDIAFFAEVPSRGDYRLFLDFKHDGVVRTAAFTVQADRSAAVPEPGHGEEPAHQEESGH